MSYVPSTHDRRSAGRPACFATVLCAIALGALALVLAPAQPRASAAPPAPAPVPAGPRLIDAAAVRGTIAAEGRAPVIVLLRDPAPRLAADAVRLPAVAAAQSAVLAALPAGAWRTTRRYELLAALAGDVDGRGLAVLLGHPGVQSVEPDRENVPMGPVLSPSMLREQRPLIGVDRVFEEFGLSGEGVRVAVIDTGIDADHPDLEDDLIDQRCFSARGGCGSNNATEGPDADDEDGHGTSVAGIITSKGVNAPLGIAPDAEIVAIRVFDDRTSARSSDIVAGFDWLERNRQRLKVKVVNMSLGSRDPFVGNCDNDDAARAEAVKRLVQRGVAVFAASGNQGSDNGMAAPACIRDVIAVAASYDGTLGRMPPNGEFGGSGCFDPTSSAMTITCFSSINRSLDLVAPGAWTTVPQMGGGARQTAGTSNASPVAAAVAALLIQAEDGMRHAEVRRTLTSTGTNVRKLENTQDFPLIDAYAAVASLGLPTATPDGPPPTTTPAPTDTPAPSATPTASATPTIAPTGAPLPSATAVPTDAAATATASATSPPQDTPEPTQPSPDSAPIYLPIARTE